MSANNALKVKAAKIEEANLHSGDWEQHGRCSRPVKLIFLDVDGPVAPYVGRALHPFSEEDRLDDAPYAEHVDALKRIVDACGGPGVVKVVLSSNWRTMDERVRWLKTQLRQRGIDMIGHTDVVHVLPVLGGELERGMEIHRALHFRTIGDNGPYFDKQAQTLRFSAKPLPADWEVTDWIAIDDLRLDNVPSESWERISLYTGSITFPEEKLLEKRGWIERPNGFSKTMQAWFEDFASRHFVHVSMDGGLAGTPGAVEKAVRLLNCEDGLRTETVESG